MTPDPPDRSRSPYTGWTRTHWERLTDRLVVAVREHTGPDGARPRLPGPVSHSGADSDALEAFARTMQLASLRVAGGGGADDIGALDWFARGLATGTDPTSPHRWPTPGEVGQAKVEAASIAIALMLTRPWLWDTLPGRVRGNVVAWLECVVGAWYPPMNWVWFQIVVEAFLRTVGGRWSAADVGAGLAVHESLHAADGWYRDGPERAYDHYCGWALHLYPTLVSHLAPDLPGVAELVPRWKERLYRYLRDAVHLIGGTGSPLIQGRSLIYRFGAAAPLWAGALAGATPLSPGLTRRATSGMVRHFTDAGVPDRSDLLSVGWHGPFEAMRQAYSGAGSPYWAGLGMLGLLLPPGHEVWTATEEPLPVERHDFARTVSAPGWLVSGTVADGIVRVVNHGTDHAVEGRHLTDSPWYARLGYSTATAPECDAPARHRPVDNTVALLDADGNTSARTGFTRLEVGDHRAVSRSRAHWVTVTDPAPDHGSGAEGATVLGPWLTIGSILRGAVEVRAVRVDADRRAGAGRPSGPLWLRVGGWPVPDHEAMDDADAWDDADTRDDADTGDDVDSPVRPGPVSTVTPLIGLSAGQRARNRGGSLLAPVTSTPWAAATGPVVDGMVYVAAVCLTGDPVAPPPPGVEVRAVNGGHTVRVTWPGGVNDEVHLPGPPAPAD